MHKNRKRNRLKGYDYSRNNLYFVTICVNNRWCCLGKIADGVMYKNTHGETVEKQWYWLVDQYPYVLSHAFVVMPNHAHGVLEIDRNMVSGNTDVLVKIKSLSELMGAFKTTSSKQIHKDGLEEFAWQRSFHDHIIRDDTAYEKICNYVDTNPERWNEDMFYNSNDISIS